MIFSQEICEDNSTSMQMICPECDGFCCYWPLKTSCVLSRITYLFDNNITVLFSIFMTIWGKFFCKKFCTNSVVTYMWWIADLDWMTNFTNKYVYQSNVILTAMGFWISDLKITDTEALFLQFLETSYPRKYGPEKYDLYIKWKLNNMQLGC